MDVWDSIGLLGAALVVGGVGWWSGPAALVLSGSALVGLYVLREVKLIPPKPKPPTEDT